MNTSEKSDQIIPAFAKCLDMVVNPKKTRTNTHLKNSYADLAAVDKAINPALTANGLMITQPPFHEAGQPRDVLMVETVIIHIESGQWISSVLQLPLAKADAQGAGSAMTYARRYAKLSMFNIATGDDDGERASKKTADWLRDVKQATEESELNDIYRNAAKTGDQALLNVLKDKCAERKQEIKIANAKNFDPAKPANGVQGGKQVIVNDDFDEPEEPQQPIDEEAQNFSNNDF